MLLSVAVLAKHQGLTARFTETQHVMMAKSITGTIKELLFKKVCLLLGKTHKK